VSERRASEWLRELAGLLEAAVVTDAEGTEIELDVAAERAVDRLVAVRARNKVMLVGNGGSAAIAQHMHNDLAKSVGLRAQCFFDAPLMTAITNDDGYPECFEQPIERWTDPGDVLVAISSSGRSENILRAARAAAAGGADVITLSGFAPDNPLRSLGAFNFYVACSAYGPLEAAHMALGHYLTDRATSRPR
jgi:D-sedoheptulose 7-phosphate isomerase